MTHPLANSGTVVESGNGPYAPLATAGPRARLREVAEKRPVGRTLHRPAIVVSALAEARAAVPA